METTKHYIDAETVHNWTQRWTKLSYYANLPETARTAIEAAHLDHHRKGANARELAENIAAQFPEVFTTDGRQA